MASAASAAVAARAAAKDKLAVAADARARCTKLTKAADGAKAAKAKVVPAASAAGGDGSVEIEFTVKNDKWVTCDACKAKVRNDSMDKRKHVGECKAAGGGAPPDPAKLAALDAAVEKTSKEAEEARVEAEAAEEEGSLARHCGRQPLHD